VEALTATVHPDPAPVDDFAALAGVGRALGRLRGAASIEALFPLAAREICRAMGFERAALFSLRGHTLVAEGAYQCGAREPCLPVLCPEPFQLGPWLRESEVLRRRKAVLVQDATGDRSALGMLPNTRSYVSAPLLCQERAVGLVQADRGLSGQAVTELDRETLSTFAEGFGHAMERAVLADRLRAQSERVLALVRSTEASVAELAEPGIELPAPGRNPSRGERRSAPEQDLRDLLTRREHEVLAMLAEGETNARIAQRLVVSEDTVKTHVKHILRKLGVHNRSQAVCRYFRPEGAGGGRALAEPGVSTRIAP
jgi:LuxR family transcriptional regulator, regulator of acetate metabolism